MHHTGIVNYHRHTHARQAYRIDSDGVPGRLCSPEHVATEVTLHDVRKRGNATTFAEDSVGFLHAPTAVTFRGDGWTGRYEAELTALLTRTLAAQEVRIFDHTLRVDDPNAERRPARNVHSDYSADGARARLDSLLGAEEATAWAAGHYAFVNVWRPVSAIVRSAPLAFVRPRTVDAHDWLTLDLIYPDRVGQILGLVGNPAHEWLFQSAMTRDEVAVFNIYDNRGHASVAHSAVDLVNPSPPHAVRRSLESRALIRYSD